MTLSMQILPYSFLAPIQEESKRMLRQEVTAAVVMAIAFAAMVRNTPV